MYTLLMKNVFLKKWNSLFRNVSESFTNRHSSKQLDLANKDLLQNKDIFLYQKSKNLRATNQFKSILEEQ